MEVVLTPAPLTAVESARTLPTNRAMFRDAKIVHVMEGAVEIETAYGVRLLTPGVSFALGASRWCLLRPAPRVRMWTVYVNERFLRTQMALFLPEKSRVQRGLHPDDWDGSPMVLSPGISKLQLLEPIWRQMSLQREHTDPPETAAARTIELFAQWVGIVAPTFLAPEATTVPAEVSGSAPGPILGRLTNPSMLGHVGRAMRLLRERMDEPWTVAALAQSVALSRAHLTRLFILGTGIGPIRFLTEVRLTEFTRLIEETETSVANAAHTVGWTDPRTASTWFRRRFGISPSQYRLHPHPHNVDQDSAIGGARDETGRMHARDSASDSRFSSPGWLSTRIDH